MVESVTVTVGETELELLGSRAVYWPAQNALLIADCHLGKAETFQSFGVSVPSGHSLQDLERLDGLQKQTGATQLYVLGDLVHARGGLTENLVSEVARWRTGFPAATTVVLGNHDRHAGGIPETWEMNVVAEGYEVGGLTLYHHPRDEGPCLYGHLHPVVSIRSALDALRLPVFVLEQGRLLLPAFGTFTGGLNVARGPGRAIYAALPDGVVNLGEAG